MIRLDELPDEVREVVEAAIKEDAAMQAVQVAQTGAEHSSLLRKYHEACFATQDAARRLAAKMEEGE